MSTALAVQALPIYAYSQETGGLTIACLCDPQLGFYTSSQPVQGYAADLANLHQAVVQINVLNPDLVLVAGDMVQTLDAKSATDVNDALAVLTMPYILTPGNHDITPTATAAKIVAYSNYFGDDRVSMQINGFKIVSGNSQLWTAGVASELVDEHNAWFYKEVSDANDAEIPVIVMTHVPPFVSQSDENNSYFNIPLPYRQELLDFCADNGVFAYIAGHTHRTHRNEYGNMSILNGETTSTNFDGRPVGYRVIRVNSDKTFTWDFVPLKNENTPVVNETISEPVLVDATNNNRHWTTVFENAVLLKWNWPANATNVRLNIEGMNSAVTKNFVTDSSNCVWQVCETEVPEKEDIYNLTLTFTSGESEVVDVRTAQLTVVKGAFGKTSVNAVADSAAWSRVRDNVVIPYDAKWDPMIATNAVSSVLEITKQDSVLQNNNVSDSTAGYLGWKIKNSNWGYGVFNLALTFPGTDTELLAELTRWADGTSIYVR